MMDLSPLGVYPSAITGGIVRQASHVILAERQGYAVYPKLKHERSYLQAAGREV
jgi:hypothetical protein